MENGNKTGPGKVTNVSMNPTNEKQILFRVRSDNPKTKN